MSDQAVRDQVDKNYEAFLHLLPSILPLHQDKYALMKDGVVVGFYSTLEDATKALAQILEDRTDRKA
jgi:hypothetical protein